MRYILAFCLMIFILIGDATTYHIICPKPEAVYVMSGSSFCKSIGTVRHKTICPWSGDFQQFVVVNNQDLLPFKPIPGTGSGINSQPQKLIPSAPSSTISCSYDKEGSLSISIPAKYRCIQQPDMSFICEDT